MKFSQEDMDKVNVFLSRYSTVAQQGICLAFLSKFLRQADEEKKEELFATFCLTMARNGNVTSVLED